MLTRVEKAGLGVVCPRAGLTALSGVLVAAGSGALPAPIASPFAFDRLLRGLDPVPYIFTRVTEAPDEQGDSSHAARSISTHAHAASAGAAGRLAAPAPSPAEVLANVRSRVVGALGAEVPDGKPLMEAVLDRLAAVELRNDLGAAFDLELPATGAARRLHWIA